MTPATGKVPLEMSEDEKAGTEEKARWVHNSQIGFGPIRDSVKNIRDMTAKSLDEARSLLEKHQAALGSLKKP